MEPDKDITAYMSIMGLAEPNGELKDISCRDMLRELDQAGRIKLPAATKTVKVTRQRRYGKTY